MENLGRFGGAMQITRAMCQHRRRDLEFLFVGLAVGLFGYQNTRIYSDLLKCVSHETSMVKDRLVDLLCD